MHEKEIADGARVIAWARNPEREPANSAFTDGPERQAAYWIEWAEREIGRRIPDLPENINRLPSDLSPEGECPHCHQSRKINKNGHFRIHKRNGVGSSFCPGSHLAAPLPKKG